MPDRNKTESRPLNRQKSVPLKTLLQRVLFTAGRDEDTLTTLAARLARLDRELDTTQRQQIAAVADGQSVASLAGALLRACDPDEVEAASRRFLLDRLNDPTAPDDFTPSLINYFDPEAPVGHLTGNLPHWRQDGVTYFVTFRLADSLSQEKLQRWRAEMEDWLEAHPEPHDETTRQEFYDRFPARIQRWLDAGYGSCILGIEPVKELVEKALKFFKGERYSLDEFVVAKNHVHVLVTPTNGHLLSEILHSWKSFTAKEILKVEAASRRLSASQGKPIPVSYSISKKSRDASNPKISNTPPSANAAAWVKLINCLVSNCQSYWMS